LKLLYLFEVLLVAGGFVFGVPAAEHFGVLAFGLTIAAHLGVLMLSDYMEGRRGWLVLTASCLGLAAVTFAAVGADELLQLQLRANAMQVVTGLGRVVGLAKPVDWRGAVAIAAVLAAMALATVGLARAFAPGGRLRRLLGRGRVAGAPARQRARFLDQAVFGVPVAYLAAVPVLLLPLVPLGQLLAGTNPGLSIQIARTAREASAILGSSVDVPHRVRLGVWLDFPFIALYLVAFTVLASDMVRDRSRRWPVATGWLTALLATAGALADVVENVRIFRLIDAHPLEDGVAAMVVAAATMKWTLLFAAALALAAGGLLGGRAEHRPGGQGLTGWLVGTLFLAGAVVGLFGVYGRSADRVAWAFFAMVTAFAGAIAWKLIASHAIAARGAKSGGAARR
jgi:hypothetical protein